MKSILPLTVFLSFLLYTCSTDLEVTADWEETPVVYGLINKVDATQYIKISKGFLDKTTSALVIAQNPDSINYPDILTVKILEIRRTPFVDTFESLLNRIDANLIGLPKDSGIFAQSPNYVYAYNKVIVEDREYHLVIENTSTGKSVSSKTSIVRDFQINRPPEDDPDFKVNWASTSPFNVQWVSAQNGRIYDLVIKFYYMEWNVNTPGEVDTFTLDWTIFNNKSSNETVGGESMSFAIDGKSFYTTLRSQLSTNPQLRRKALDAPLDFLFYVGGEELYNYIRVNRAQTGITQLQVKPEYTNIEGGLGIFSSRFNKAVSGVEIHNQALDSLSCGSITGILNFVDRPCN